MIVGVHKHLRWIGIIWSQVTANNEGKLQKLSDIVCVNQVSKLAEVLTALPLYTGTDCQ